MRGHAAEPEHVVVLRTLGAPQRHRLRGRRARAAETEPAPAPVTTSRATVIGAEPFRDDAAAERWLQAADVPAEAAAAVVVLERVAAWQRLATADPRLPAPALGLALAARVGIGAGEDVAEGRWRRAVELPAAELGTTGRPRRRDAALRPQERLAALLGARDAALACELLTLRARDDVDAGRLREAAFQLGAALDAATAELEPWRDRGDLAPRLDELAALREEAAAVAVTARSGGLGDHEAAFVARALGRLEAALRARTALGFE